MERCQGAGILQMQGVVVAPTDILAALGELLPLAVPPGLCIEDLLWMPGCVVEQIGILLAPALYPGAKDKQEDGANRQATPVLFDDGMAMDTSFGEDMSNSDE